MTKSVTILTVAIIGLLLSLGMPAQDLRAKLAISVTDSTGLAVPNADLELRYVSTGEVFRAKSNESGVYSFLFLQPGVYSLKVAATGFKTNERESIALQSYQASGIEVKMEVGGVAESVTVTAEGALLQTESASRGITVDNKLVITAQK